MDKETRFRLEERAARTIQALVRRLPLGIATAFGGSLGRVWSDLDRRHVTIAVDNLRRSFPEWDEVRLLRTARATYAHFGRMLFEVLWLKGRSREQVVALVEVQGREHALQAFAAGRGIVFPTAHVGNWELTAMAQAYTMKPFGVVARHLDNAALERLLHGIRSECGNTVIYKQRALSQMLRILKGNGGVGILLDQNVQEMDGIFVDFFGRPANATTVAAALAVKTGCALIPGYTRRLPDGRYRVIYDPPVRCEPSGDRNVDIARLTQLIQWRIEGWIRAVPEQWLWMHRRWHTQPPPGEGVDPMLRGFDRAVADPERSEATSPARGD